MSPGGEVCFLTLLGCVIRKIPDGRQHEFSDIMTAWDHASRTIRKTVQARFLTDVATVLIDGKTVGDEGFLDYVISKWEYHLIIIRAVSISGRKDESLKLGHKIRSKYECNNEVPRILEACVENLLGRHTSEGLQRSFRDAILKKDLRKAEVELMYSKWADKNNKNFYCDDDVLLWLLMLNFLNKNADLIFPTEKHTQMSITSANHGENIVPLCSKIGKLMSDEAISAFLLLLAILEAFNSSNFELNENVENVLKETFGNNIFFNSICLSLREAKLGMALCIPDSASIKNHRMNWFTTVNSGPMKKEVLPIKRIEDPTSQYWLMLKFPEEEVVAHEPELPSPSKRKFFEKARSFVANIKRKTGSKRSAGS